MASLMLASCMHSGETSLKERTMCQVLCVHTSPHRSPCSAMLARQVNVMNFSQAKGAPPYLWPCNLQIGCVTFTLRIFTCACCSMLQWQWSTIYQHTNMHVAMKSMAKVGHVSRKWVPLTPHFFAILGILIHTVLTFCVIHAHNLGGNASSHHCHCLCAAYAMTFTSRSAQKCSDSEVDKIKFPNAWIQVIQLYKFH